jgi:hypothetical protein
VAVDAAKPQTWIIEECRRQAVMYLADAAGAASIGTAASCPRPLVPQDERLAMAIAAAWKESLGRRQRPADLDVVVDKIFQDAEPSGLPQGAWTVGELVGWWLAAGETLARHDAGWRKELEQVLNAPNGMQPAALWCADRGAHYGLVTQAFKARRSDPAWEGRAKSPQPYLHKLIAWVGSKDRQRPHLPDVSRQPGAWMDAMRQESASLAEDAQRLLGLGCTWTAGESLTPATVSDWVAVHWLVKMREDRAWEEVRRPVVDGAKATPRVMPGWVVCQPPGSLVHGLLGRPNQIDQAKNTIEAALQFAARLWQPSFLPSHAWPRGPGHTVADSPVESQAAFLAVVRLLAAIEMEHEANGEGVSSWRRVEELRIALALDGFSVAAGAGNPRSERLIPRIGNPCGGGHRRLEFVSRRVPGPVAIGWTTQQAFPATRFARAVEELDWLVWHLSTIARSEPKRRYQEIAQNACEQIVQLPRWESLKRRLLDAGMAAAAEPVLADTFGYAHRRRLALELRRRKAFSGPKDVSSFPALDCLVDAFQELAAAILERLHIDDAAALSRLVPPRTIDGSVDGIAWVTQPEQAGGKDDRYDIAWRPSDRPLGTALEEHRGEDGLVRVVLSSADASDADVRVLNVALGSAGVRAAKGSVAEQGAWADLVRRLAARIRQSLAAASQGLDLGADIAWLRKRCVGDDAAAFHALVSSRLKGEPAAVEWCGVLSKDDRFGFVIHPPVDLATGAMPRPTVEDEQLRWEFHPTISAGSNITVEYGLIPSRAVRTLSRGLRVPGSPADRADALEIAAAAAGTPIDALATMIRAATDRWVAFPSQAAHPATAAVPLLRSLVGEEGVPPPIRSSVFTSLVAWAASVGHEVIPGAWSPDRPLEAAALPQLASDPMFHAAVPEGCLVLGSLGLEGTCAVPVDAAVSAGPPPAGYAELLESLESLVGSPDTGQNPSWRESVQRVRDLPRHAIAKTLALAGPNLYDCIWEASTTAAHAGDPRIEDAKERIVLFLKAACGMVTFQPVTPRDFASGWVQEVGGSPPRGRRIRSLVRPGLRTLNNGLVRPALVITE